MRVISKPALREFWERHADAEDALCAWWSIVGKADWKAPADILQDFPSADTVGGGLVVFDIRRNAYRLVVSIDFRHAIVFIYGVYTHADYDRLDLSAIARRLKDERAERKVKRDEPGKPRKRPKRGP